MPECLQKTVKFRSFPELTPLTFVFKILNFKGGFEVIKSQATEI